ncbi:MAG: transglutaminase domain-containing protein [Spirochaetes bacterium]|nr:transglutaminase domain-containing protein [Spirochaetota bacterium]
MISHYPYVGEVLTITGDQLILPNKNQLNFGKKIILEPDSLYIEQWNNQQIKMVLPDIPAVSALSINQNPAQIIYPKRVSPKHLSRTTQYTLKRIIHITLSQLPAADQKIWLYVPQPILSDTITSAKTLSINPAPDYIQDNQIMIYQIDQNSPKTWNIQQKLQIETKYKEYIVDLSTEQIDSKFINELKKTKLYHYYTQAESPFIIPDHPAIKEKVNGILGKEQNHLKKLYLIYQFVTQNMEHQYPPENRSPLYCLKEKKGDCLSDAYLFTSLARAAGYPVRLCSGYIFYHTWQVGGLHFWEEVFIPGMGWFPLDLSFGHNGPFLEKHQYPTKPDYYFGGIDGRRMAFSQGRVKLMRPDQQGNLVFFKYVPHLQIPRFLSDTTPIILKYKIKNRLIIEKIEEVPLKINKEMIP